MPLSSILPYHQHIGLDPQAGHPQWVILHGLLGSSRNWGSFSKQMGAFSSVWLLDMRNHGRSPHASPSTYEAMLGDLLQFLESYHLKKIHLIGHSMGGKLAMLLACRYPEYLEQLVVLDIAPKRYQELHYASEFYAMQTMALSQIKNRQDAEAHMANFIRDPMHRQFILTNLQRNESGAFYWQVNLPALKAALPELAMNPLEEGDSFKGPSLFVRGGRSHFIGEEDAMSIKNHFPNAEIVNFPASGHNPHIDAPSELLALLSPKS